MPNWAEGSLKLRGKRKDIGRFLNSKLSTMERLVIPGEDGRGMKEEWREKAIKWDWQDPDTILINKADEIHINGMSRHFIEFNDSLLAEIIECHEYNKGMMEIAVYYPDNQKKATITEETECMIALPLKAAWCVSPDDLSEISKEYNLQIRVYAIEGGLGFVQDYTIKNGEVTAKFKAREEQYFDFAWNCPFPGIGG